MAKLGQRRRLPLPTWILWQKAPVLVAAMGLVLALDQVTKAVVRHYLAVGESVPAEGTFRITHTFNTGTAFGLFPDQTLFLILASLVGIGILLFVYRTHPFSGLPLRVSLGMQLGGALGNLLDRLRMGQVTDFVNLGFWPIFNVADASIVIGIIIVAGLFIFAGKEEKRRPTTVQPSYGEDGRATWSVDTIWEIETSNESAQEDAMSDKGDSCQMCGSPMIEAAGRLLCWQCGAREPVEDLDPQ